MPTILAGLILFVTDVPMRTVLGGSVLVSSSCFFSVIGFTLRKERQNLGPTAFGLGRTICFSFCWQFGRIVTTYRLFMGMVFRAGPECTLALKNLIVLCSPMEKLQMGLSLHI